MVLVSWLVAIFTGITLFAPRSMPVMATTLVGVLAVSTAILRILELDTPFHEIILISSDPLHFARGQLER